MCAAAAVPFAIAAVSAINQAAAQRGEAKAAEYEGKVAEQQAAVKRADMAQQRDRALGKVSAGAGASGLALEGSPVDVLGDTARDAAFSKEQVDWEEQLAKQRAKARARAANAAAVSSLMGSSVLQTGYNWANPPKETTSATASSGSKS